MSVIVFIALQFLMIKSNAFWKFFDKFHDSDLASEPLRLEAELRTIPDDPCLDSVFLFGSSITREGVDKEYLNLMFKNSSIYFYNFAWRGFQPLDFCMMKNKFLSKKPRIIIYPVHEGDFYSPVELQSLKWTFNILYFPRIVWYIGVKNCFKHRRNIMDSFLGMVSPLYKYRNGIVKAVNIAQKYYLKNGKIPDQILYRCPQRNKKEIEEQIKKTKEAKSWRYRYSGYSSLNERLFVIFIKHILSTDTKLVVLEFPVRELNKKLYERIVDVQYEKYISFIEKLSNEVGFTFISRSQMPDFEDEEYLDLSHLNYLGRKKMSDFIIRMIENDEYHFKKKSL